MIKKWFKIFLFDNSFSLTFSQNIYGVYYDNVGWNWIYDKVAVWNFWKKRSKEEYLASIEFQRPF